MRPIAIRRQCRRVGADGQEREIAGGDCQPELVSSGDINAPSWLQACSLITSSVARPACSVLAWLGGESGEHHEVVQVRVALDVQAVAGDQSQSRVVDIAVDQFGGKPALPESLHVVDAEGI